MPTNGSQTEILIRQGNINEAQLATKLEMGSEMKEKEKKVLRGLARAIETHMEMLVRRACRTDGGCW